MKKRFEKFLIMLFLLWATSLASSVYAVSSNVNGAIRGQVTTSDGSAVEGVKVTVKNPETGFSRTVTTNSSGEFRTVLAPGTYSLSTSHQDYKTGILNDVSVALGSTTTVTLPLEMGSMAIEEVFVLGQSMSMLDTGTAETALNITLEEVERIPVPRSIEDVAKLAPGTVSGDSAFGENKDLISFGGASVAENAYFIDGLNVTNFRNGLGGASVPFEFYDEFQIKTGGYGAEFGRSLGGVLNAVTKKGTNDFHYGVVSYYEPEALAETSPNSYASDGVLYDLNSENTFSSFTTDVYVSGPILKDKLFFYALYEFQDSSEEFNSRGSPATFNDREIDDDFWGANLLWNINESHSILLQSFTDERVRVNHQFDYDVDARRVGAPRAFGGVSEEFRGGKNSLIRYDGQITDTFSISALYGKNEYDLTSTASTDVECPYVVDLSGGAIPGNDNILPGCQAAARVDLGGDEREAFRIDFEWLVGDHAIRAGIDNEVNTSTTSQTYSGTGLRDGLGVYYRYYLPNPGTELSNGGIVPDANGDGSPVPILRYQLIEVEGEFETKASAYYLEDRWEINDFWTVSLGVRNEVFENLNGLGEPFIETDDQWAPRFAAVFSPGGTGDSRVFFNYGRYFLPIANNTNVRLAGAEYSIQRYFLFDGAYDPIRFSPTSVGAEGVPTTTEIGEVQVTANGVTPDSAQLASQDIEPMYQDEYILGYEREFESDFLLGVKVIYRDLKSAIDDILINEAVDALGYEHTGDAGGYVLNNPGTDVIIPYDRYGTGELELTTFPADLLGYPKAKRTYKAVEITFDKTFDFGLTLAGSYTWSKSEGNTEGYVKSDNGQDDAGITQDFDEPILMDGAFGYLPNDRRHKLKVFGTYDLTENLAFGTNLSIFSGRPINKFGVDHPNGPPIYGDTYYVYDEPSDTFEFNPRGSAGRTDWVYQIDMSLIYDMQFLGGDVQLRADVFNLLNGDAVQEVYEFAESSTGVPDARYGTNQEYQTPRYFRFGASWRF